MCIVFYTFFLAFNCWTASLKIILQLMKFYNGDTEDMMAFHESKPG